MLGYIYQQIRTGHWTHKNFPTKNEMRELLNCARRTITAAHTHLEQLGILVLQSVPGARGGARLLPVPSDRRPYPVGAARAVSDGIKERILSGEWAGVNFPVLHDIRDAFHCSLRVASDAMQLLEKDGWVHLITVEYKTGGRGPAWKPVTVPPCGPDDIGRQIEHQVRTGALTGRLPGRQAMAADRRVHYAAIARAYQRLQDDGYIARGWLPDLSSRGWYVLDGKRGTPRDLILCESKGLALAVVLRQHLPTWLMRGPRDNWYRCRLPAASSIADEYGTSYRSAERAIGVLERTGIIERGPLAKPTYLPVPPTAAPPGLRFEATTHKPGRAWSVTTRTGEWLPLPTCDDDAMVVDVDVQLGYRNTHTPVPANDGDDDDDDETGD